MRADIVHHTKPDDLVLNLAKHSNVAMLRLF